MACNCKDSSSIRFTVEDIASGKKYHVLDLYCPVENIVYAISPDDDNKVILLDITNCKYVTDNNKTKVEG